MEKFMLNLLGGLAGAASGRGAKGRLFVLIYHQVFDRVDPMRPSEPDVPRFAQCMSLLAKHFHVLPLAEGIRLLREGRLPRRAVAITFDDGYCNNFIHALPVLEGLGLPATFFVATGFLDGGRMWNDTVIEALRRHPEERLMLPELGLDLPLVDIDRRRQAAEKVIAAIKHLPMDERSRWVDKVSQGVVGLPDDLMMTSDQVRQMRSRGMEIGGHTVNHPILAKLDDEAARQEIQGGKDALEELLQEEVRIFAYPNGKRGTDYTERDIRLVQSCGFEAAVSTNPGTSKPGDSPFEIRRFTPWDRTPFRFLLRMIQYYRMG